MEKHWKSVISRSVCDYFFEEQKKISSPIDMPPVLATPHHYLITIFRCNMYFVAVCTTEGMWECLCTKMIWQNENNGLQNRDEQF